MRDRPDLARGAEHGPRPGAPLLSVRGLSVAFGGVEVVDSISFEVDRGEVLGVVGESGCGKSVTALALMGLLPKMAHLEAETLRLDGEDLLGAREARLRALRGATMSMIFQEPMTALNPVLTIGGQIVETIRKHDRFSRRAARERAVEMLARVGIPGPAERMGDFPHQLSGGMRQRVMIAMAIACNPKLLIADEPTTALDVTIQAQILELLRGLQEELGMGIVMITHDLGVVSSFSDRVVVMYAGRIVEAATAASIFERPAHPYTRGLLASLPSTEEDRPRLSAIPGTVPPPFAFPSGCRFRPRCAHAAPRCAEVVPPLEPVGTGHRAACIRLEAVALEPAP